MAVDEIVLPITEPETEWVRGRALQKMSPLRDHGRLQMKLGIALDAWSEGRGEVAPEWRFRVQVPGQPRWPLVPDLAYVSYERMRDHSMEELQALAFAPTVAIEILSPGDDRRDVADKVETYLRAGSDLVMVVDPKARTIALHDPATTRILDASETLTHEALPGLELELGPLFAAALDRQSR